jgi:hypothetical protein
MIDTCKFPCGRTAANQQQNLARALQHACRCVEQQDGRGACILEIARDGQIVAYWVIDDQKSWRAPPGSASIILCWIAPLQCWPEECVDLVEQHEGGGE